MDTAIIPGVPLEFSEDDIVLDVNREYRAICVKFLTNKGVASKIDEVKHLIHKHNFKILGLTETL